MTISKSVSFVDCCTLIDSRSQPVGRQSFWCCGRRQYSARTAVHYDSCQLHIKRRGRLKWEGIEIGSGFDVELEYGGTVRVTGEVIGLTEDFDLTPALARFLELNQEQIYSRSQAIEEKLLSYRRFHRRESRWKERVLSYRFLVHVYDHPCPDPSSQTEPEQDLRVRQLLKDHGKVFTDTFTRYQSTARTETAAWWYIFWVSQRTPCNWWRLIVHCVG